MAKMIPQKIHGRETKAIEDLVDLKYLISFENTGGSNVGALLLERNGRLMLRFCFGAAGINNDITRAQGASVVAQLREVIRDIPLGESLIVERHNFPDYQARYAELDRVLALDENNPYNGLIFAERQQLIDNSSRHLNRQRNQTSITLWPSITAEALTEKLDPSAKVLLAVETFIKSKSGQLSQEKIAHLSRFLVAAWPKYLRWHQIFNIRLNALKKIEIYDAQAIWQHCWHQINRFSGYLAPAIPDLLKIDIRTGSIVRETDRSDRRSTAAILFSSPVAIPATNYTGIVVDGKHVVSAAMQKHCDGWSEEIYQLNWLADVLASSTDTRVVLEFKRGEQDSIAEKLRTFSSDALKGIGHNDRKNKSAVRDMVQLENAEQAERDMLEGAIAVKFGLCFFFHRDTVEAALASARSMSEKFGTDGKADILQIEKVANQQNWFQSLPITQDGLLTGKIDRQMELDSISFPSYLPLATPVSIATQGLEMRSKFGRVPIYLDIEEFKGHIAIYGTSRESGKTVIAATMMSAALARGRYGTIIDIPKNGCAASFRDYTQLLMGGDYFDIRERYYNFLAPAVRPPQLDLDDPFWQEIEKDNSDWMRQILLTAVLGADLQDRDFNTNAVDSILTQILNTFFQAREIRLRYREAKAAGLGTTPWANTPTVVDFIKYCQVEQLNIKGRSTDDERILGHIRSRLSAWFVGANCKAPSLAQPSDFDSTNRLLTIALREFASDDEAAVFGLVAQGLAFRRAIRYMQQGTYLFNDENGIALEYPSLARGLGSLYANGLKANMIACAAMQPPDTIAKSVAAGLISSNITYNFVGKIPQGMEWSYAEHLGLPEELVMRCSEPGWGVNKAGGYSSWLFSQAGHCSFVEIEPMRALLEVMRNNEHEIRARQQILAGVDDPFDVFRILQSVGSPTN
jgi:hypothetical protein